MTSFKTARSIGGRMKAVALMSDGIDSPVAIYLMAKKGVEITCLFGRNTPEADLGKPKELVRIIREASGGKVSLLAFEHFNNQEAIKKANPRWFQCLVCKRMMVRVASALGEKQGAEFVIMGDSLGQVASQTLANIKVVEQAADIPIIRPLIGLDKREIEDIGREVGTYDISIKDQKVCPYVPKGPSVRGNVKEIIRLEEEIGVSGLVERSLEKIMEIDL
jgi:thiamine biosynthesis protein ThiI